MKRITRWLCMTGICCASSCALLQPEPEPCRISILDGRLTSTGDCTLIEIG